MFKDICALSALAAFARGAYEFRRSWTWADPARPIDGYNTALDNAYDLGRDFAHRVTLRHFEER